MSELIKYRITFPVQKVEVAESYDYPLIHVDWNNKAIIPAPAQIRVSDTKLTFSIGNIKCRTNPCVIYFKFYGLDYRKNVIAEYTSERMVVSTEYTSKSKTFTVPYQMLNGIQQTPSDLDQYYIELYAIGADSENPLYFNHVQLNEGTLKDYHRPNDEKTNVAIGFNRNHYISLYDMSETYLQIIRPKHEGLTTDVLTKSQMTILAPHLPYESEFDDPVKLFYEYMYMTEQRIGVEK